MLEADDDALVVEDVDDDSRRRHTIYQRDALALPRSADLETALAVAAPGRRVFAMYPETTSFYEAVVTKPDPRRPPQHGDQSRFVQFDDDDPPDKVCDVPVRFTTVLPSDAYRFRAS